MSNTSDDSSTAEINVDANVLSRIQAKESLRQSRLELYGTSRDRENRLMDDELGLLAVEIRQLFKEQHRQSMKWDKLIEEMRDKVSVKSRIEEMFDRLVMRAPDWCTKHQVGRIVVFKILNMDLNVSELRDRLKVSK